MTVQAQITQLLQRYFDLLYYCDLGLFDTVFHPLAIYVCADETPLLYRTMPEYRAVLAGRQSGAARQEPRYDQIDSIDVAGGNTALAQVRCAIGQRRYTDLLSLVRSEGRWYIMAKVFHLHPEHRLPDAGA